MSLRLANLRLGIDESEAALPAEAARVLGLPVDAVSSYRILRKNLDARDRNDLAFVYTLEVRLAEDDSLVLGRLGNQRGLVQIEPYEDEPYEAPTPGGAPLAHRPLVVGSGPAGLAAA